MDARSQNGYTYGAQATPSYMYSGGYGAFNPNLAPGIGAPRGAPTGGYTHPPPAFGTPYGPLTAPSPPTGWYHGRLEAQRAAYLEKEKKERELHELKDKCERLLCDNAVHSTLNHDPP